MDNTVHSLEFRDDGLVTTKKFGNVKYILLLCGMNIIDEILKQYEKPEPISQEQVTQIKEDASTHLWNYLCGDGDVRHLYEYNDCMDKIY